MTANNIDEVLDRLDTIIGEAKTRPSRLGFFPAVYRPVTFRVKQGIETDYFDDATRMDAYTTQFANRYLMVLEANQNGQDLPRSWKIAFETANKASAVIVQHILLGMNAHINYDLSVVTAEIGADSSLPDLEADYNRINDILASVLDEVQAKIGQVSPLFDVLDRVGGNTDEMVINFSLKKARQKAWKKATLLVQLPSFLWQPTINILDSDVALLGRLVAEPGGILSKALELVRWSEEDNISEIIDVLR